MRQTYQETGPRYRKEHDSKYRDKRRERLHESDPEPRPQGTGTVKWFDAGKGYGFILPDNGGADVFVHARAVEHSGLNTLTEGQRLSYELAPARRARQVEAANLKIV